MNLLETLFTDESLIEIAVGGLEFSHRKWITYEQLSEVSFNNVLDAYFGPAHRAEKRKMGKTNILGSNTCWVDVDRAERPFSVLPPSAVVWSGHGWHFYWFFEDFITDIELIEKANNTLAQSIGGDSAHNVDRMLRVPGSVNAKREPYVKCKVVELHPNRTYSPDSLIASTSLSRKMQKKIQIGDRRGYRSRSERDWAIIRNLVRVGLSDEDIHIIFQTHDCGDKYRDPQTDGDRYLKHTLDKIRESTEERDDLEQGLSIMEGTDGYYVDRRGGRSRVSTFTIEPNMLLEGDNEDSIMGNIAASGTSHVWQDVVIPKSAFLSTHAMSKHLDKAAWVWLGSDSHVRELLAFLVARLQAKDMPRTIATNILGRHTIPEDDRTFFVANNAVLASDGSFWNDVKKSPIVYVEPDREAPRLRLPTHTPGKAELTDIARFLPLINTSGVIWPMIGWFFATPFKPWLNSLDYRFPILNVFGTRGSGKSSTILQVFQPLLGFEDQRSYDAMTTRFVILTLLGSTNATPITFSEFRAAQASSFIRYILLAYDTGRDPRGRPNQTTQDYPLSAPFTLDGEDMVSDPATLERVIAVRMIPSIVEEGSDCWTAFQQLQVMDLSVMSRAYLTFTLQTDAEIILDEAEEQIFEAFPEPLPPRVRRNLTVCWFGVLAVSRFFEKWGIDFMPKSGANVLNETLEHVYSTKLGRAPTAADEFIEIVVNAAARGTKSFPWQLQNGVIWFQLTPAYEYFVSTRARQRQTTLSREALKTQILELVTEYTISPEVKVLRGKKVLAYGVDLEAAHTGGLDVPSSFKSTQIIVDLN